MEKNWYSTRMKEREAVFDSIIHLHGYVRASKELHYACYSFEGRYVEELENQLGRRPTEEEIILLVDCCPHNFGAECTIDYETRTFTGRVNTD